jgi:hypothetical protein
MLYPLIPLHVEKAWELVPSHLKSADAVYKLGWFQPKAEWRNDELAEGIKFLDSLQEPTQMILTETLKRRYTPHGMGTYSRQYIRSSWEAVIYIAVHDSPNLVTYLEDQSPPILGSSNAQSRCFDGYSVSAMSRL